MKAIVVIVVALITNGCATLLTADQQTINIAASNSMKIGVTVDDKNITTPNVVEVLRDGKDKVALTNAEGCTQVTPIEKVLLPEFFFNIVIGGLPGSSTDAATGKMWSYEDSVEIVCTESP